MLNLMKWTSPKDVALRAKMGLGLGSGWPRFTMDRDEFTLTLDWADRARLTVSLNLYQGTQCFQVGLLPFY